MTLNAPTLEQIREITHRAVQEGRIPSPDACDEYGQPLLTWEAFAALFGLTPEQAQAEEAEEAEFFQHLAEVAYLGPIRCFRKLFLSAVAFQQQQQVLVTNFFGVHRLMLRQLHPSCMMEIAPWYAADHRRSVPDTAHYAPRARGPALAARTLEGGGYATASRPDRWPAMARCVAPERPVKTALPRVARRKPALGSEPAHQRAALRRE